MLLTHRYRRALLVGAEGEPDRWVSARELARLRRLKNVRQPAEWVLLQPMAPCTAMHDPALDDDEQPGRQNDPAHDGPTPLWRLLGMLHPELRDIRVVVGFAVGVSVLSLATPLAVEALVTTVALNLLVQQLVVLSLILLIGLSSAAAMRALQFYVLEVIQRQLFARVASDLAYRLPRVEGGVPLTIDTARSWSTAYSTCSRCRRSWPCC